MGDYLMSLIKANDLTNVAGGIPTVKSQQLIPTAWASFQSSGTVAIQDSENISSITDSGTGLWKPNFTTTMANTNYAMAVTTSSTSGSHNDNTSIAYSRSTSQFTIIVSRSSSGATTDANQTYFVVMGGQS
jgi:hypothetical protein